jgi:hypothetical protein
MKPEKPLRRISWLSTPKRSKLPVGKPVGKRSRDIPICVAATYDLPEKICIRAIDVV